MPSGRGRRRVTLQTIADDVGVSRMTVSNAFSRPDQLSATLRATILARAEELGYVGPDPAARALARGTTGAIGVLLTQSMASVFSGEHSVEFFSAVAQELAPTGLAVTLLPSYGSRDVVPARDVPLDGALIYAAPDNAPAMDWLVRRRLPLVFVDRPAVSGSATVTLDEREAARQGAQHLLDLGHVRVGVLTQAFDGPHGLLAGPHEASGDSVSRGRVEGWFATLEAGGAHGVLAQVRDNSVEAGREAGRLLLDGVDRPTAVLCFSDEMAAGVLQAAREMGLTVPDDVSVVGFDDAGRARRTTPPLTTIRQDVTDKGRRAAATLLDAIALHRAGSAEQPADVVLGTELVVRGSTAPPALR
ncbi:LacI family transcriptional regulator [Cellulomonas sp. APG4]|uniref:LacI family DNA-binding transcriptional regulator n=1 Tax=Cellulomonas sp. APG4 TaxID=1538656 RepID=UPI00137A0893|nr:LacI family DNA-binding transcriptional regulator [Cellulomonas sp. APG4]NCT92171.1 LacI family transcriptional regulator [Cellulomonas sp. APG4]